MKKAFNQFNIRQNGFTLIELIVAIAITSVVIAAASGVVFQLMSGNSQNTTAMTAVRNVQQAGHWISKDLLMADIVEDFVQPELDTNTDVLTIYRTEYTAWHDEGIYSIKHRTIYQVTENGELFRYHSEEEKEFAGSGNYHEDGYDDITWVPEGTTLIARFIDLDTFYLSWIEGADSYELNIKTYVPGFRPGIAERIYDIKPRSD